MGGVASGIEDAVSSVVDTVGTVVDDVVNTVTTVAQDVGKVAENVVQNAINDPIGTIAKVGTAILAPELLPVVMAADVLANGGSLEQAATGAALSYVTPAVAGGVSDALAGTGAGDALTSANQAFQSGAQSVGLDAGNNAVTQALTKTGIAAGTDLATGKDPSTALDIGLGSLVGNVAGASADTGSNTLNNIIGNTAGAVTTADLQGKNADQAAANAIVGGGLNAGISSLTNGNTTPAATQTADSGNTSGVPTLLASNDTGTVSDAGGSPTATALANNSQVQPSDASNDTFNQLVNAFSNPATYNPDSPTGYVGADGVTPVNQNGSAYTPPDNTSTTGGDTQTTTPSSTTNTTPTVAYVDTKGNAFDSQGNNLGKATELGFTSGTDANGQPVYLGATGTTVPVQGETQSTATNTTTQTTTPSSTTDTTPSSTTDNVVTKASENTNPENVVSNNTGANATGENTVVTTQGTAIKGTGTDTNEITDPMDTGTPAQVINNDDGSITTIEKDGSQNILKTDGTIVHIGPDGAVSNPLSTEPANGIYPDGNGGYTDINGKPTTQDGTPLTYDEKGNLVLPNGTVYSYAPSYTSSIADGTVTYNPDGTSTFTPTPGAAALGATTYTFGTPTTGTSTTNTKTNTGLTSIIGGLLNPIISNVTKPATTTSTTSGTKTGGSSSSVLGTAATIAGLMGASANGSTLDPGMQSISGGDFAWNSNAINPAENGVAYGQQILNPTYTTHGKAGGMANHLAHGGEIDQPAITQNGFMPLAHGGHVHREIFNGLKEHGHPIDSMTIAKVAHLSSLGAPAHHIIGFLNHERKMANGGLGAYSDGGRFLKGPGDGMSDDIPANIGGHQEARLANEEFVIPADVVSHLGNGSSEAGAKVLYKMMDKVRHARTGTTKQGKQINPDKFMPK